MGGPAQSDPADAGMVIVEAGQGGLQVAESLRAEGYDGPITLIGEEDSATVRSLTRVPVTITGSRTLAVGVGGVVWAQATGVARAREMATASRWC